MAIVERAIHIVKLTTTGASGSGSATWYFARDYYAADDLYSGSPEIFPMLTEWPRIERDVGPVAENFRNVTVSLWADSYYDDTERTLLDEFQTYEITASDCAVLLFVDGDVSLETRYTGKVKQFSHNRNRHELSLQIRSEDFLDKDLGKKLNTTDLPDLDDDFVGEYGPIVIGQSGVDGVHNIIDAPYIDDLSGSSIQTMRLFTGWTTSAHKMNALGVVHSRNEVKTFKPDDWVAIEIPNSVAKRQGSTLTGASAFSLVDFERAIQITPPNGSSYSEFLTRVRVMLSATGTLTADTGELAVNLYFSYLGQPEGQLLAKKIIDHTTLTGSAAWYEVDFERPATPHLLTFGELYHLTITWTGTDTSDYVNVYVKVGSDGHYYLDKAGATATDRAWQEDTGNDLALEWYTFDVTSGAGFDDGSTETTYSYFQVREDNSADWEWRKIKWKIGVKGLEDDGSGTYTSSANSLIYLPTHVIHFLLRNSDFGMGIAAASLDTSSYSTAQTALDARNSTFIRYVIDKQTSARSLIHKLCREHRLRYYTTRAGKIALNYPTWYDASNFDYSLTESHLRGDMTITDIGDRGVSYVVNKLKQSYYPDPLNLPKDRETVRRAGTDKYKKLGEIDAASSTYNDGLRESLASKSQSKYGVRERSDAVESMDVTGQVQKHQFYMIDRYHEMPKTYELRLLLKDYRNIDFFDTFSINHTDLPAATGTIEIGDIQAVNSSGSVVQEYNEGVPVTPWVSGKACGEVTGYTEQGPFIYPLIETVESIEP